MSVLDKHPVLALAVGALTLAAISGTGLTALSLSGAPLAYQSPSTAGAPAVGRAQPEAVLAKIKDSPADSVLNGVLESPPQGWKAAGTLQRAAAQPMPFDCPVDGTAPSVSVSRLFSTGGHLVQVVLAAYRAGLGAEVMKQQLARYDSCAGDDIVVEQGSINGKQPGVEAHLAIASKGQAVSQVLATRRGDVLAFYVADAKTPVVKLARAFDVRLGSKLNPVCANPRSQPADASRSPWSASGYKPYTVSTGVAVRDMAVPQNATAANVLMVQLPAPTLKVKKVDATVQPWYPVWPPMPEPMAYPEPPKSPDPAATTEKAVRILTEDKTGPGCGWAFTGMPAVPFDSAAADKTNRELTRKAVAALLTDQRQWQQEVLDYWKAYGKYKEQVAEYKKYAAKVSKVNATWAGIEDDWNQYWARYARYQDALATHNEFLGDQADARTKYAKELERCTDKNKEIVKESEAADVDPETVDCRKEVGFPAILSQTPPAVPAEPAPPADPAPNQAN
ncbi:hypothetical protein LVY72_06210 [Arthrobacter sp. I2-34]|uniref:Uncharacterized protein n=1 Tax=Arthrobacter hankyongi TaxID=2904801 RepID=A0ABS9L4V6_9MICC|nr:hypothetical protein [Arthrobacter hankyongi]MCG2621509.1 hypothetical protein [Arthrobacter hankyongi]